MEKSVIVQIHKKDDERMMLLHSKAWSIKKTPWSESASELN
jgi:hypothetical protein